MPLLNFGPKATLEEIADWHKAKSLCWHHFRPVYLPPYSPDFNAIERLWQHLKSQWFAGFTVRTEDALMDRLLTAFASHFAAPEVISSQCRSNAFLKQLDLPQLA